MGKCFVWTSEAMALLGTMTDAKLAAQLGVSKSVVWYTRKRRSIQSFARSDRWSTEDLALLGTASDLSVGAQIGKPGYVVAYQRNKLGVPAWRAPDPWTPERVALLGQASDGAVARVLSLTPSAVGGARRKRGIPAFCTNARVLTPEQVSRLGTASDRCLAAEWGLSVDVVIHQRNLVGIPAFQYQRQWTQEERALLGTMSDAEVGRRVGRSREAVKAARYAEGIKKLASAPHPSLADIRREYTTTSLSVREIAARYGVSNRFVVNRARRRGWARPQPDQAPECPSD